MFIGNVKSYIQLFYSNDKKKKIYLIISKVKLFFNIGETV